MKKLLNPLAVSIFFLVWLLGSIAHLMYGSCQTTKYHYMCQAYWMPKFLPNYMARNKTQDFYRIPVYSTFDGIWKDWYKNGNQQFKGKIRARVAYGKQECWHENGNRSATYYTNNGINYGTHTKWYANGVMKSRRNHYTSGSVKVYKSWDRSGVIDKVEFFDKSGDTKRDVIYKKGILFKVIIAKRDRYSLNDPHGIILQKEYYDTKGKFLKREIFEKGKLVKTEREE